MEVKVGEGERAYFNGGMQNVGTDSSVLVSSSKYLNHQELRHLIAQEMLRRNGPDLPTTAFIPEVAQIMMMLEDFPRLMELFEEEKARLPQFKAWCDNRSLSDFKKDDVRHCKPGTLGAALFNWMETSGYELDVFYRELVVVNDLTFYLRQAALNHDIEHLVTGFGPNHGGEVALLNANMYSRVRYFRPELAAFFNRIQAYLKAKTVMKDALHYPEAFALNIEAEFVGASQAHNWTYPIMLADWRSMIDWQMADIRKELGITPVPAEDLWSDTNRLCDESDPAYGEPLMEAAE
ncbi:Coq4 family protein [Novosphingobium sp. B 225]|uniref:Coq4 family protein n=1 Tax=Novosphingobium sp. B 225 TaxID=1961849 RepID=UPI000B4B480D|nr:Coq4 family protein [Novosphingobium sp. B 225]